MCSQSGRKQWHRTGSSTVPYGRLVLVFAWRGICAAGREGQFSGTVGECGPGSDAGRHFICGARPGYAGGCGRASASLEEAGQSILINKLPVRVLSQV